MRKAILSTLVIVLTLVLVACGSTKDEIKVYTRDTTSGTRGAFFDGIDLSELGGTNEGLVEGFIEVASNGDMMASIRNDINGIGYISLSGLEGSGLKGVNYNGVKPSEKNVLNNTYTLKRPFMYIRKAEEDIETEIEKQLVNAFLAYMNTKEGKAVIYNAGGIVEQLVTDKSWDDVKDEHALALEPGSEVEIHFGGSTSVEAVGRALTEAFQTISPRFKPMHAHAGSGAAYTGTRADGTLHIGFASRDLKDSEKVSGQYGSIAFDAVVLVVNKESPVTNLTKEQVQDIYKGNIKTWDELK